MSPLSSAMFGKASTILRPAGSSFNALLKSSTWQPETLRPDPECLSLTQDSILNLVRLLGSMQNVGPLPTRFASSLAIACFAPFNGHIANSGVFAGHELFQNNRGCVWASSGFVEAS